MSNRRFTLFTLAAALLFAGCATDPMEEQRELEREQAIADILSFKMDPEEYGETKRCLSSSAVDSYRALDDQHILFKGRRDRLWISRLRGPCPGLDPYSTLIMRKFGGSQICRLDSFQVTDWFGGGGSTSPVRCILGDFQPVTEKQVEQIEAVIEAP